MEVKQNCIKMSGCFVNDRRYRDLCNNGLLFVNNDLLFVNDERYRELSNNGLLFVND